MKQQDQWRPIPGFPGYHASSNGSIYSERSKRVLRPSTSAYGYQVVTAVDEAGRRPKVFVHRLVLAAFVGPCPEGMEGCHGDGDRDNNTIENLRWDTHSGNVRDAVRHGTHSGVGKTRCKHDHPFDDANTGYTNRGTRYCITCARARARAQRTNSAFRAAGMEVAA